MAATETVTSAETATNLSAQRFFARCARKQDGQIIFLVESLAAQLCPGALSGAPGLRRSLV